MKTHSFELSYQSPSPEIEKDFLNFTRDSESLHLPWVRAPKTSEDFQVLLDRYSPHQDQHRSFVIFANIDSLKCSHSPIVGVINLSYMIRGAFQNAFAGYYGSVHFAQKGLMKQAFQHVLGVAFGEMGLHRIESNIIPENKASIALIRSLGFRLEGLSKRYLFIDGRWQDHERYALTSEEWSIKKVPQYSI